MKKWQKISFGIAGVLVLALVIVIALLWPSLRILIDTGGVDGTSTQIPESPGAPQTPVEKGDADWICWRGPKGDGRSLVTGILKDWSGGLQKLWEVDFLCQGGSSATWSAPVVQGKRLVVCGRDPKRDLVFCLNTEDGKLLWQGRYEAKPGVTHGAGPRATPWIDNDRVYTFGRGGDLACWNLLDGKEIWRVNVEEEGGESPKWGHSSSPLIVGKLVVVQGGGSARTIAYDKRNGDVAWKSGKGLAGYAALTTMLLGSKTAILAFHGEGLAALDAETGSQFWNVPWETAYDVNATTPVTEGDKVFITSGYGTGCELLKADTSDADTLWRNKTVASHHSDPFILDGFIYGYSGQSFQNRGAFKCVELETGKERWSTNDMGWGTCVYVDGLLLCCDIKGNLFLMKPDPERFIKVTELSRALGEDVRGPVWTIPVIANGRLYLRFKQRLISYALKSAGGD